MFDAGSILAVAGTFLLAGAVKGVIGLGLPTVSLAVLAVAIDLPTAMALLLVPSFVTNVWQGAVGGHGRDLLRPDMALPAGGGGHRAAWRVRADARRFRAAPPHSSVCCSRPTPPRTCSGSGSASKRAARSGRARWPGS